MLGSVGCSLSSMTFFMPHLFIQILNAIGINMLYFLPTCRLANTDDCLFGKVHPLRRAALYYMVCWAVPYTAVRLQKTRSR